MKNNKLFVLVISFGLALVLPFLFSAFAKPVFAAQEEIEFKEISSYEDLNNINDDLSKNYKLGDHIDISENENFLPIGLTVKDDNSIEIQKFTGIFDGNGYTIKGLSFDNEKEYYHYGLFAHLDGATIKNLNLTDIKLDNEKVFSHDTLNNKTILAGGVAAISEASIIENISVSFEQIKKIEDNEEGQPVEKDKVLELAGIRADIGGVVGRAHFNTKIKNVKVDANFAFNVQAEKLQTLNMGLVTAELYRSEIQNVIAKGSLKVFQDENFKNPITNFNLGGIAGVVEKTDSKIISTYSNIVFETKNIDQEKTNKGALVGYIKENEPPKQFNISYNILIGKTLENNVATSFNQTFGKATTYNIAGSIYNHLEKDMYSIFDEKSYWVGLADEYKWNTKTIWELKANNLPALQMFDEYEIALNINKTRVPLSDTLPEDLLVINFEEDYNKTTQISEKSFRYNEKVTVMIVLINDFDIYYHLKSVEINDSTVASITGTSSNYELSQIKTKKENEEDVIPYSNLETTRAYLFSFHANHFNSGEISVTLEKVTFELVVETQNSSEGRVRKVGAQVPSETLIETISVGNPYEFVAVPTSNDFAPERWVMELVNQETLEPYYVELEEYGKLSNITFQFGKQDSTPITENFLKGGKLVAIFSSNITKITFMIEEGDKGENKNAGQIFDGSEITEYLSSTEIAFIKGRTLTFVAKEKEGYTFMGWFDSENRQREKNHVLNYDTTQEEDVITLIALYEKDANASSLLVLWIVLGSVAGAGLIVVLIIVIKRKRSDYSYKSFY